MTTRDCRLRLAANWRPLAAVGLAIHLGLALVSCGSAEEGAAEKEAPRVEVMASHDAGHAEHPAPLPTTPSGQLPSTSIYHLASAWTDHHTEAFSLPELRGGPAVLVMFYGDCTTACPLLVKSAEDIAGALSPEQRAVTSFVMISFDTDRDTPEKLAAYAAGKGLTADTWHWLVGNTLQTRQLATLLGVQYRAAGNGMFAHSNVVTVVDSDGVPAARLEGLGVDLEPAITVITAITEAAITKGGAVH